VGKASYSKISIDHLKSHFKFNVKGGLKYILGIEVITTENSIELSQRQYITDILSRFGMQNCRTVQTPIDPKAPLVKADRSEPSHERTLYQQMVASLMYLVTCTRPDLAFSVSYISCFSSHRLKCHQTGIKRIFHYLARTQSLSFKSQCSAP